MAFLRIMCGDYRNMLDLFVRNAMLRFEKRDDCFIVKKGSLLTKKLSYALKRNYDIAADKVYLNV